MGNERGDSIRNRLTLKSVLLHTCQDMALWFYTREWSTQSRCFTSAIYLIWASKNRRGVLKSWLRPRSHLVSGLDRMHKRSEFFSFEELQIVARKWTVAWIDQVWFGLVRIWDWIRPQRDLISCEMRVLLAIPRHWLFSVSITLSIVLCQELMLPLDRSSALEQVMIR